MDYRKTLGPFGIDFAMSVEHGGTEYTAQTLGTGACTMSRSLS